MSGESCDSGIPHTTCRLFGWSPCRTTTEQFAGDLSSNEAKAIYKQEGADWYFCEPYQERKSLILISHITKRHLAAVWECGSEWTYRIDSHCLADSREEAKSAVERMLKT